MYSHKKDREPIETIALIRKILTEVGIFPTEQWCPDAENLYVARLRLPNQYILSEGKGVTAELALASAYGELMERLQNNFIKSLVMPIPPDSKLLTQKDFLEQDNIYINKTFKKYFTSVYSNNKEVSCNHNHELIKKFQNIIEKDPDKDIECVPFYSVKEKKEVLLPYKILELMHTPNGMCAGNTPEEALVQGISEILERYAAFKIVTNNLVPPSIPQSEYKKYKTIMEIIEYYQYFGYKVDIRDCSLGERIPVVGVFLIDTQNQQYCTSFAAHPDLPIAIERCFTEIRQERDPSLKGFKNNVLNISTKELNGKDFHLNTTMCFYKDVVQLSSDFFSKKATWNYSKNIWGSENSSNKNLLNNLLQLCLNYSEDIYIRDVSFLGFPSYNVVIPEMSVYITNEEIAASIKDYRNIKNIFSKAPKTNEEIKNLLNGIEYNIQIKPWVHNDNFFATVTDLEFAAACSLALGKESEAIDFLDRLLKSKELKNQAEVQKLHCLKIYLELNLLNKSEGEISGLLDTFYSPECKREVLNFWINSNPLENIIQKLIKLDSRPNYVKDLIKNKPILEKLDIKYKNNIINQSSLAEVITI